jgi:hypothetical protein
MFASIWRLSQSFRREKQAQDVPPVVATGWGPLEENGKSLTELVAKSIFYSLGMVERT